MSSPVKITDGERTVTIDPTTHALIALDSVHHEIHEGKTYRIDVSNDALGNNASLTIDFLTPATGPLIHFTSGVSTGNVAKLAFYEGVELTSNGTAVTPLNANRSTSRESAMQFAFKDSTLVTTNATELNLRRIGTAPGGGSGGGGGTGSPNAQGTGGVLTASRPEFILKPNTWYSLVVTNICGEDQAVWLGVDWYEHISKE